MHPTLRDGEVVLVDQNAYLSSPPNPNDIVLALHPYKGGVHMVKRVLHLVESGHVFLKGDNPLESSDSRAFGAVHPSKILGQVIGSLP